MAFCDVMQSVHGEHDLHAFSISFCIVSAVSASSSTGNSHRIREYRFPIVCYAATRAYSLTVALSSSSSLIPFPPLSLALSCVAVEKINLVSLNTIPFPQIYEIYLPPSCSYFLLSLIFFPVSFSIPFISCILLF